MPDDKKKKKKATATNRRLVNSGWTYSLSEKGVRVQGWKRLCREGVKSPLSEVFENWTNP